MSWSKKLQKFLNLKVFKILSKSKKPSYRIGSIKINQKGGWRKSTLHVGSSGKIFGGLLKIGFEIFFEPFL